MGMLLPHYLDFLQVATVEAFMVKTCQQPLH